MKLFKLLGLLALICLFAGSVHAVSRVGGGKVRSQSSGFEMLLPAEYFRVENLGTTAVLARGPIFFHGRMGRIEAFIRISEFMNDFSDARELSRNELEQRLQAAEWTHFQMPDACIAGFKNVNGPLISYIFTWGGGKGFVVNTSNLKNSDDSVQLMLQSLQLDPGSCAWK